MGHIVARRLFQNHCCQLYHFIVFFIKFSFFYLVSFVVSFFKSPLDFWHSYRYCGINTFSVSCTCITLSVVRCTRYFVGYKHLLCQLYAQLCRWYELLCRLQIFTQWVGDRLCRVQHLLQCQLYAQLWLL